MSDQGVRRWTGWFGIASGVLVLVLFVIYGAIGTTPRAEDAASFTDFVTRNSGAILTITLAYALSAVCLIVFLAGLRYLIRQARSDYEWVSGLVFGAGLVDTVLGLVGLALLGSAALSTINHRADPTLVSALGVGSTLVVAGVGSITAALFLASAGYAILGSGVLPRWNGWVAYGAAVLELAAVPAVYAGSGPNAFYTADGYVTLLGVLAFFVWLISAGVSMVLSRQAAALAPTPARVITAQK